jgi:adenylate cyclase
MGAVDELPIGIGIQTGNAFVGSVGEAPHTEMTALGDVVNTAARLASAAGAGEILVSREAADAAGLDSGALEHRSLELKGKSAPTEVVVVTATASVPTPA